MTVVRVRAEAAHKARLDDYASYEAAKCGVSTFLRNIVDEVWYNDLKDAETFYTRVLAINIMAHLDANSGGLHALDMISLRTNMTQYYAEVDGIPQFIVMMEDAQKKAKRAGMPIADVELVMMASAAVLAAQHFLREVDDWEGLPAIDRTWRAWKVAFHLAHIKRQRQLQATGGGESLCGANSALPAPASTIDRLGTALNNLALAAANDTTVLQQLTASNLALSKSLTPRSPRPTRSSWKRWRPSAHLQWRYRAPLQGSNSLPRNLNLATTVGRMVIVAASFTQVRPAEPGPQGTRLRQRPPTRWEGVKRTRDGTLAPDGVGGRLE